MSYASEIVNKKYKSNVVIKFLDTYFSEHDVDKDLDDLLEENIGVVDSLSINGASVDLKQANTTIASYSFSLLDKDLVVTKKLKDRSALFFNAPIEIWIGRITGNFSFNDYYKLPITKIKEFKFSKNKYQFKTVEPIERIKRPFYSLADKLKLAIDDNDTVVTATEDITDFPSSGTLKIEDEFITYTAKNNTTKEFSNCTRGALGSLAVAHEIGPTIFNVTTIQGNPVDILLKLMISGGGGGTYDVLFDGIGIDQNLVDITEIESIRDSNFSTETFLLYLYNIPDALEYIEKQILLACNLRFTMSENSKISVALLDQSVFGDEVVDIDETSISSEPTWGASESKIINRIVISWDFDEGTGFYRRRSTFEDADSITEFGQRPSLTYAFKGIKESLDGEDIINNRGTRLLARFATPTPDISFKTHIDKSLVNIGDKIFVTSREIPTPNGDLNFGQTVEVISRTINHEDGQVQFKVAFTSYTGIRSAYISPSDLIVTVIDQKTIEVATGRGACYSAGWIMRLWNDDDQAYEVDGVNEIASIVGDVITFVDNFSTTLLENIHRIRFADYDDVSQDQRKYAFISDQGNDFSDGTSTYRITF